MSETYAEFCGAWTCNYLGFHYTCFLPKNHKGEHEMRQTDDPPNGENDD